MIDILLYSCNQSECNNLFQIVNGNLVYNHNLGDGILRLPITGLSIADGQWYTITLTRRGGSVTLQVVRNGTVVGYAGHTYGRAQLLDTQPTVVHVGAQVDYLNGEKMISKNLEGWYD